MWLYTLLTDIGIKLITPMKIYHDKKSAIKLAYNPVFHKRIKHISAHYHYTRDKIVSGEIQVNFKPLHEQLVDLLAKPLDRFLFEKFKENLQLRSLASVSSTPSI